MASDRDVTVPFYMRDCKDCKHARVGKLHKLMYTGDVKPPTGVWCKIGMWRDEKGWHRAYTSVDEFMRANLREEARFCGSYCDMRG